MDKAAAAITNLVLVNSTGDEVQLGDLWEHQPVVFNWLRHYG